MSVMRKAIDVTPYHYTYPCMIEDTYREIDIVLRRWSEDGKSIWFMLDTHNFVNAAPDEQMEVVQIKPNRFPRGFLRHVLERDAERMGRAAQ